MELSDFIINIHSFDFIYQLPYVINFEMESTHDGTILIIHFKDFKDIKISPDYSDVTKMKNEIMDEYFKNLVEMFEFKISYLESEKEIYRRQLIEYQNILNERKKQGRGDYGI